MGDKIGVIIGMGGLWDKYHACQTTSGGPNPFQTCKFPFSSGNHNYNRCVNSKSTPSARNEVCNQFYENVNNDYLDLVQCLFCLIRLFLRVLFLIR